MTNKEAQKIVKKAKDFFDTSGYPQEMEREPYDISEALGKAIEVFNKLEPIKPIEINDGGFFRADMYIVTEDDKQRVCYNHKVYGAHTKKGREKKYGIHTCKLCGCDFDEARDNMYAPVNFCPCCGQAIDWSDT